MIKSRSFFFFNTSNPTIQNGGFLMESKKAIYDLLPQQFYPKTILIDSLLSWEKAIQLISSTNFNFPLIGKPDIGMRGLQVKLLRTIDDIKDYHQQTKVPYLIQEFVHYENEVGIFFYKIPGENNGTISGIVGKEFLTIQGDGISSIEILLQKNSRYLLQIDALKKAYGNKLAHILAPNEWQTLVPYGNHSRGAKFIDLSYEADVELNKIINQICNTVPEFYYGRLDIRFRNWDDLRQGKNFYIIELNGAGSEPTHIYDPVHSVFFAWKEIIRHLAILYKISTMNHRLLNIPYMSFSDGIAMLKANTQQVALLSSSEMRERL